MTDTLYIDSKEPGKVQKKIQEVINDRCSDVVTEVTGLKTGDFVFKDVVVERKEASDLASSIQDGRIKSQCKRMSKDFNKQYILVEGSPYNLKYSGLHRNAFNGLQVSLVERGVKICFFPGLDDLAYGLYKVVSKNKGRDAGGEEFVLSRTSVDTENLFVAMVGCIDGVSKDKAERVCSEFGNMFNLVESIELNVSETKTKLTELEGIGDVTAEKIIDGVETSYPE